VKKSQLLAMIGDLQERVFNLEKRVTELEARPIIQRPKIEPIQPTPDIPQPPYQWPTLTGPYPIITYGHVYATNTTDTDTGVDITIKRARL
jgi:hypothetical protein